MQRSPPLWKSYGKLKVACLKSLTTNGRGWGMGNMLLLREKWRIHNKELYNDSFRTEGKNFIAILDEQNKRRVKTTYYILSDTGEALGKA
jgi:hypothetical protein